MTPDDIEIHIQTARMERNKISTIIKEEVDSINVLRTISGMKGKLYWKETEIDGNQSSKRYYVSGMKGYLENWWAGMVIHSHRTRIGVFTELKLREDSLEINLMTKCRAIMNKQEYKIRRESQLPGERDFIIRVNDLEELRQYFKIFLKVEGL